MNVSVTFPKLAVVVSDKAQIALAGVLRDVLKKQAKDGVMGRSRMLMPRGRDGKRVDLIDTGNLWNEVSLEPLRLRLLVPYARFVMERYGADQLSPRYQDIFNERALKVLSKKGAIQIRTAA